MVQIQNLNVVVCVATVIQKNNTKVAPAEPTTAASSDEAWNFARRDDVVFQTGEEKTTDPNSSNAETDGTTSGDNDLDDDFASLDTTDPDGGDMQQMGVAPIVPRKSSTMEDMKMAQNFTQRLQKNRR